MSKRAVKEVEVVTALHIAKTHAGALERVGSAWTCRVTPAVVAELLRRGLVEPVKHDVWGARRIELNLRGQDLIADAQHLIKPLNRDGDA